MLVMVCIHVDALCQSSMYMSMETCLDAFVNNLDISSSEQRPSHRQTKCARGGALLLHGPLSYLCVIF